jgi:hypothetical protein
MDDAIKNWSGAMNQFAILFEGRVPMGGPLVEATRLSKQILHGI